MHPDARVGYVDIDEIAVAHSKALRSVGPGLTTILADIRDPDVIINHPELTANIDFEQPVGVLIFSVVDVIPDSDDPWHSVRRFREQMTPSSFFALARFSSVPTRRPCGSSKASIWWNRVSSTSRSGAHGWTRHRCGSSSWVASPQVRLSAQSSRTIRSIVSRVCDGDSACAHRRSMTAR